ncbi:phosphoribosylformylglycinamidine synthase I [Patescibacteria group bacterium]|nr:phosphoribosylformylglycinamidine synthase I [Patescibacteria group bacterium]
MKPKVLVFSGYGLNCEEETTFAFEKAGAAAEIIHINDLIKNKKILKKFQIMAFPGGFSYGDDTGSGNAFANKLKNHLWKEIREFAEKDKLIIGICNGFQIMVNLGLLPALNKNYGKREVALLHNDSARYIVRWIDLKIENNTPWFLNINNISLPIAHGEGKFYADDKTLKEIKEKKLISAKYIKGGICNFLDLKANPNGSLENIASMTDESGRILGMMPHPERAIFFTQLPHWTYLKEKAKREKIKIEEEGPGLKIFKNSVNYFKL